MKTVIYKIKNILNENNGIFNNAEEKISKFKAPKLNLPKKKHTGKTTKKKNRVRMLCGTTSSNLIYM